MLGMPRESLEIMMGIVPRVEGQRMFKMNGRMLALTPKLMRFLRNKWRLGDRFKNEFPALKALFDVYDWQAADSLSGRELLVEIDRLYGDVQRLVYYNINVPILMAVYNALLGRSLKKAGVDLKQFDVMEGMTEHLAYDPQVSLKALRINFSRLDRGQQERIRGCSFAEFENLEGIEAFQREVAAFLQRFGHLSDSGNDFSSVPWREKPEMVLKLLAQETETVETMGAKRSLGEVKLGGLNGYWMRKMHQRAQQFRLYREQISSLYTYAYGLFRPYFLALGRLFVKDGLLETVEDVFYLSRDEIREMGLLLGHDAQAQPQNRQDYQKQVLERKAEMVRYRDIVLPVLIYGDAAPVLETGIGDKLSGVPTSRGYYQGRARVVRGLEDFSKVMAGDVVVIPYSDVSWTPLFARAGAVVAESGGMLSHSSIVAREYQIPAVVSVEGAVNLPDGVLVSVDGFRGEVIVHGESV
jgi:pyruvate,water dikinase